MAHLEPSRKVLLFGPVPLVFAAGAVILLVTVVSQRALDGWLAVQELEALFAEVVEEQLAAGRVPELGDGVRLYQGSGTSPGFFPDAIRDKEPGFHRVQMDGRDYRVLIRDRHAQRLALMKALPAASAPGWLLYAALGIGWAVALMLAWGYGRLLRRRMDGAGPHSS